MTELTAKKYLESKGLNDHDYMDSGMINHISEMMEEYHQAKLHLLTIPAVGVTCCEKIPADSYYLGMTCPKCRKPFRQVNK